MIQTQILEIEKGTAVTADHKNMKCYDMVIELSNSNMYAHSIRLAVSQSLQKVSSMLHAQTLLTDKNGFEGAVKAAVNQIIESDKTECVKFHIGRMEAN